MRKHYYKILLRLNWIPGLDEVYYGEEVDSGEDVYGGCFVGKS